jgi:hypothetical protein
VVRGNPALQLEIAGFVLAHLVFVGLSFAQLWLARERGLDPAGITRVIGGVQIVFGTLGALLGGAAGDGPGVSRPDAICRITGVSDS